MHYPVISLYTNKMQLLVFWSFGKQAINPFIFPSQGWIKGQASRAAAWGANLYGTLKQQFLLIEKQIFK
jgi:hypothetical protein